MKRTTLALTLTLGIALVLSACGGGDRSAEDLLSDAQAALRDAREAVLGANEALKERESVLDEAKKDVEAAREQVRAAQSELTSIEANVDLKATDGLLFRAIQRRLLDDERLEGAAVRVKVDKGVVTLQGEVPDGALRDVALEVARSVSGVASVDSQLNVAVSSEGE